jgi:hypothetical protein
MRLKMENKVRQLATPYLTGIFGCWEGATMAGRGVVVFLASKANSRASSRNFTFSCRKMKLSKSKNYRSSKMKASPPFGLKDLVVLHPSIQQARVAAVLITEFRQESDDC